MLEVKNIYDALQTKGFSTLCDVYSLGSGEFNQELITAIDNCTNFILVLRAHSLERCSDDEDWLYYEIKEVLEKKKNIICIFTSEAFGFCGKLKTITLNKELERIASTTFNNCGQLMEFVVAEDNSYYSVHDRILYDYDQVVVVKCPENYNHDVLNCREQ